MFIMTLGAFGNIWEEIPATRHEIIGMALFNHSVKILKNEKEKYIGLSSLLSWLSCYWISWLPWWVTLMQRWAIKGNVFGPERENETLYGIPYYTFELLDSWNKEWMDEAVGQNCPYCWEVRMFIRKKRIVCWPVL